MQTVGLRRCGQKLSGQIFFFKFYISIDFIPNNKKLKFQKNWTMGIVKLTSICFVLPYPDYMMRKHRTSVHWMQRSVWDQRGFYMTFIIVTCNIPGIVFYRIKMLFTINDFLIWQTTVWFRLGAPVVVKLTIIKNRKIRLTFLSWCS